MAAVNCPLCELRFASKNERDWHLRNEHEHLHVHPPVDPSHHIWWRHQEPDEERDGERDGDVQDAGSPG